MTKDRAKDRDFEFGHDEDDDAAAFDDIDQVDWAGAEKVQRQIDEIESIKDPVKRKEAAIKWAAELAGTD